MKRRQFLQSGSLLSVPVVLGGMDISAVANSSLFNYLNMDDERVLVLIQLNGGNDGLNMIIPLDQYSGLSAVRPLLMLPESSVLKLTDKTGIHPAMSGLNKLYKEGMLAVVQSVGYPNQNRSHFRSTDIWMSASDAKEYIATGWAGRYFDGNHPTYPSGYPNNNFPDPLAITISSLVSETCQGTVNNFSYALTAQSSVKIVEETIAGPSDNTCYSAEVEFVRSTIKQSNAYASNILSAFSKGKNVATYPTTNLATQLKTVANLIAGGLRTKIYVVSIGGFDTHASQVQVGEPTVGNHANLLKTISDAVSSFMDDLKAIGLSEKVVGMTFSEFGRQIRANNSLGTDHGTAAPLILFGSCVNANIYGNNPQITSTVAAQEGVPMQYDFRSVYASLLIDWLGVPAEQVKSVLFKDFQKLPIVKNCSKPSSVDDDIIEIQANIAPNPCSDYLYVNFNNIGKHVHLSIFNAIGSQLDIPVNKTLSQGPHEVMVDTSRFQSGSYFVRLAVDNAVQTLKFIKI
ncbi:MAG: DUF1501 domain-containing protein [Saprospiraceae bacterium]|jgi:uncharacterized protein (DUF1501 family)|nr:DUF1501 domain-containing protein [Saprospiraceae bacterium]